MSGDSLLPIGLTHTRRLTALLAACVALPWSARVSLSGGDVGAIPKGVAVYTLMPDSSDNIHAAIDRTVSHMNFLVRGIARGRLTKINPTPHQVRVDLEPETVSVAFDNGNPVVTPVSGDSVPWRNPLTGETNHARVVIAGDTVRQTISAHDGERENALIFSDNGARLRLRVTVTSHRLPRPLVYELLFRENDAPGTGSVPKTDTSKTGG